ncbi:YoaK family protein [Saccharibacillus sp. CPCC 101409]|uniref:YoaK family protein n=1 Tax=Saccharibacillus sp. CPCC 101409 TaxID=3058041 RepID=UPI002673677F|nr:YoaK family protein [Saccharibacillus sp. CPCC 101409]MDO3411808.1 YoaK family protein [Saccharibacillus sp. CPCC 101409]
MHVKTWRSGVLMLLCMSAGIVDVIGYIHLGRVFTANMTGNIVILGMSFAHVAELSFLRAALACLGFIAGNAAAAVLLSGSKAKGFWPARITLILFIELAFYVLFAALAGPDMSETMLHLLILLLSSAMGMQTTAARKLGIAGISTTVLTNNLASVIEDFVAYFRKRFGAGAGKPVKIGGDTWLRFIAVTIYCFGALVAGVVEVRLPFSAIWIPILVMVVVLIVVLKLFRGLDEQGDRPSR